MTTPAPTSDSAPAKPSRWALSLWGIARDGRGGSLAAGQSGPSQPGASQLGASQVGARATYALTARLAAAARISAPLRGSGREAALGIDWRPTRAPVHLVVEQRLPLDGGAARPAAFLVGGLDPRAVGAGFRLEAYAQAGGVARRGGFADGAARLATTVPHLRGLRLDLGVGAWGGAQRGASRIDIGPTAALTLPVAGRAIRLTLDWRQRIAGDARPGSGPALSIGGDF